MTDTSAPPNHIWATLMNRTIFGFSSEVDISPETYGANYVLSLIEQEKLVLIKHGKTFISLLILNSLSVVYVQGVIINFKIFGHSVPHIPASGEVLCLLLGLIIFGFSIRTLDVMLFARMRWIVVHKITGSDLVNLATAHLKGDGIWADILAPRFVGYSSGKLQLFISSGFYIICMVVVVGIVFLASEMTLIELFRFGLTQTSPKFSWPTLISVSGLVLGNLGILTFVTVLFVPFRFKLPIHAQPRA
ncbi:MAG: hypothetical protein ACYS8Z_27310 [Planctomycetota bacterium]|jgi:hypothetical protein